MSCEGNATPRKPYQKPQLRTIELVAEEVLGIGCKMFGSGSNVGSPTSCSVGFCVQSGS